MLSVEMLLQLRRGFDILNDAIHRGAELGDPFCLHHGAVRNMMIAYVSD